MSVSLVGQAQAATTSTTYPAGIAAGDLILYFGYRNTTTAPTLPTGFTNITNGSANANAYRLAYEWAAGTETGTTPTFTNATGVEMVVYRGVHDLGNVNDGPHAASTTATILALSPLEDTTSHSWVVGFLGSKQSTSMSTPSGMTLRGTVQNITSGDMGVFDTNGNVSSFVGANSTLGASATYATVSVELKANPPISSFTDQFNTGSLDATKWDNFLGTGATISAATGDLEMTTVGANAVFSGVNSHVPYDWTGSGVYLQVTDPGNTTWTSKELTIGMYPNGDAATDGIFIIIGDGTGTVDNIAVYKRVATVQTQVYSGTYDTTNQKWLRIRESSGSLLVDGAPDTGGSGPGTWTNIWTATNPFAAHPPNTNIGNATFEIDFGNWSAMTGSSTAKMDNVNFTPTPGGNPTNLFFF